MPAAYITKTEATELLAGMSITANLTDVELELASDDLDLQGPFVGQVYSISQLREFPRDTLVRDDVEGQTPLAIKRWVALTAYQLAEEDDPNVTAEKVDDISETFHGAGKRSRERRLKKTLLKPYKGHRSVRNV